MKHASWFTSFRRGDPQIWLTGSALGICILMIAGLILIILVNGLSFFWPQPLEQITLKGGSVLLGEIVNREAIPDPGRPDHLQKHRILLRLGNRDLYGFYFKWVNEDDIQKREAPEEVYFVERREYGPLLGTPVRVKESDEELAKGAAGSGKLLPELVRRAARDRSAVKHVEKDEIGEINYRLE